MLKRIALSSALLAISAFVIISCGGNKSENTNTGGGNGAPPEKPAYQSAGDEGTVTGKILFTGAAPAPKVIDMGQDPVCVSSATDKNTEDVVVKDGKLANVFVYVKSGGAVDKFAFNSTGEATLDQKGCRYHPHVLGVMTKENIKITNSDNTTHNIHPSPTKNQEWNQSQTAGAAPLEKSFARQEVLIPVKCNQHPWMKAYIGVLPHPFFAVSKDDGSYTISNLPPGEYTIVAWHEKYGEQTQKVTVGAKESKTQDFTFSATSAYAPGSLKVEPALVLN
jgi:hypothetical protein